MAKLDENENSTDATHIWNTWEELLLACAVHRYGSDSWESVAVEVQNRSSTLRSVTALVCQQKYVDLKRRFADESETADEAIAELVAVPWLDELRELRVAELKREVERYDMSISSLQMKVKKLEEERETSLKEKELNTKCSDLDIVSGEKKENENKPDNAAGEASIERTNRCRKGSNSRASKAESPGTGSEEANKGLSTSKPEIGGPNWTGGDSKPAGEDSCRGSCEESEGNLQRVVREREPGDSPESVAESKGEMGKENSDVQSSASLPRKDKQAAEMDNDNPSPSVNIAADESQPSINFLEILQSEAFSSVFSRRLDGQEIRDCSKLIKQNLDFETIRTRLEEGWYVGSSTKLFRDLLVLVNNTQLVYEKGSSEFEAAVQLRQLVHKEMAQRLPEQNLQPKEQTKPEDSMPKKKPEDSVPDLKPSHSLSVKPRMSVPIIACRKRSSLAARTSISASGPENRPPKTAVLVDEKPIVKEEKASDDETPVLKKKAREQPSSSSAKKVTRGIKSRSNTNTSSKVGFPSNGQSSNDSFGSKKADQSKKTEKSVSLKKQSAASFLKRLNGGSPSEKVSLSEAQKIPAVGSSSSKRGEPAKKKNEAVNDKAERSKPQSAQKRSDGKKPSNEKGKKNTKRGTIPSSSSPAKRAREDAENKGNSAGDARESAEKKGNSSNRVKKRRPRR